MLFVILLLSFLRFEPAPGTTTYYLVRHAEKACDDCATCGLSNEGTTRAQQLASYLSNKGIDTILASQCLRTRNTAQPLANALGKSVSIYQTTQLTSFINQLKAFNDHRQILIVGHSNQVPVMIDSLADQQVTISETDYDNLFIIKKRAYFGGKVSLKKLTYGTLTR